MPPAKKKESATRRRTITLLGKLVSMPSYRSGRNDSVVDPMKSKPGEGKWCVYTIYSVFVLCETLYIAPSDLCRIAWLSIIVKERGFRGSGNAHILPARMQARCLRSQGIIPKREQVQENHQQGRKRIAPLPVGERGNTERSLSTHCAISFVHPACEQPQEQEPGLRMSSPIVQPVR